MIFFRAFLILLWLVLVAVIVQMSVQHGTVGLELFVEDLVSETWRSVFMIDFVTQLLIISMWAAWRYRFSLKGIACGFLCLCGGGLFSLIYIALLTFVHRGNMQIVLLGDQAAINHSLP